MADPTRTSLEFAVPVREPPRMHIKNLRSQEEVIAQFNPSEFEEAVAPKWATVEVQGLSHEIRQFLHTGAYEINLALYFHARSAQELAYAQQSRRRLLSWANPRKVADDMVGGGPPTLLLVWPGMLSLQCDLISLKIKHSRFNLNARSVLYTATCTFAEAPGTFLTSEQVSSDADQRLGDTPRKDLIGEVFSVEDAEGMTFTLEESEGGG